MRLLIAALFVLSLAGNVRSAEKSSRKPLRSGPKPGDSVPSFYTRAVTGPLANKSVCYVCRNGDRPVVMLLMRRIGRDMKPLLTKVDKIVDGNRASGLRGFGVLIDDNSRKATSAVQTFAFNNKIQLPLTVSGRAIAGAGGHKLHKDAALTVVLYRRQKVVRTWSFRAGEIKPADVAAIAKRLASFARSKSRSRR